MADPPRASSGASASTSAEDASAHAPEPLAMERLVAGGAAGALSRVLTAPIDRVKILFQVNRDGLVAPGGSVTPVAALGAARRIVAQEGVTALWRGTGAAVTPILPYSATTFAVYPMYNAALAHAFGEPESGDIATRFAAGALAGTTATVFTYPLDLLHARSAAHLTGGVAARDFGTHHGVNFAGVSSAASSAAAASGPAPMGFRGSVRHLHAVFTAGGVRSLYAGIGPTLMGIVPYGGLSFAAFETMKTFYKKANDHDWDEDRMPLGYKLAAGGCAGFVAQTVTYPLHVVRRRMQVHGGGIYAGVWEGLRDIYAKEGAVNGLFKGVGLTWLKGPIAAAIGFTANDVLKLAVPAARRALLDAASKPPEPTPATYLEAKQVNAIESLVAGGLAGAVAKTTIAPADRVKIIYQVDPHRPFTLASAARTARDIVVTEGPLGLWRGNGVMMARVVPYAGVTFLSYPRYEAVAKRACETIFGDKAGEGGGEEGGGKRIAVRFIAGSAAGATATTLTYPLDLMRARYAASGTVALSTPSGGGFVKPAMKVGASASQTGAVPGMSVVSNILRQEGIRGLYGGLTPTLVGIIPYAGISFATFETLKGTWRKRAKAKAESAGEVWDPDANAGAAQMPVTTRLLFGGLAGLFAQSMTYPLDIVRRRIQVVGRAGGYESPWRALFDIARTEGLRGGLYKGVTMNWVKGPVSVAVSFFVNDSVKAYFRELHETGTYPGMSVGG